MEVVGLLTTVTEPFDRVSIHGVRTELLDRQARELGLPVHSVRLPYPCPNEVYERRMARACRQLRAAGVTIVAFGDLFLEDVRAYRESRLAGTGLSALFPLWGRPTGPLAREMLAAGLGARIVCLDPRKAPARFAGRRFDARLLDELPSGVDPCGENGEFHTFVEALPEFRHRVPTIRGPTVERDGFLVTDLAMRRARTRPPGARARPGGPMRRGSRRSP